MSDTTTDTHYALHHFTQSNNIPLRPNVHQLIVRV